MLPPYNLFSTSVILLSTTLFFFFFNDTATTEIYTLSLHDALPILATAANTRFATMDARSRCCNPSRMKPNSSPRSEEHTSELQSHSDLVCRLLLEKKKYKQKIQSSYYINQHIDDIHFLLHC